MFARSIWRTLGLATLAAALGAGASGVAGQAPGKGPAASGAAASKKRQGKTRAPKIEKLACRLGTEDKHARIAVELFDGKVNRFAYYSKWKPRTCSMEVERGDAYSKWEDTGNVTIVTLIEDNGAFLIDNGRGRYHFIFREIDRKRYCGMEGKVSGSLTVYRGRPQCLLEGVMDRGEDSMQEAGKTPPQPLQPAASAGGQ